MIRIVPETGSTNADLAAGIAAGEPLAEGEWLVADRQSAGRGRQGRAWLDGHGNFMGSTLVQLGAGDPPSASLALVAGVAVIEAVAPLLPPPQCAVLKWPNDLLVNGAKLCGILLERVGDAVVVGIGINLASAPTVSDRATVALSQFGPAPDRDLFAQRLAQCFAAQLAAWRAAGLQPLLARWAGHAHPVGTPLLVRGPDGGDLSGTFAGLNSDGALQLLLADGTTQTVHAGEVLLAAVH